MEQRFTALLRELFQGDSEALRAQLGHASIQTTEVYTHLDRGHVLGVHRLYHPRA